MKKFIYWGIVVFIVLLIGAILFFMTSESKENKESLNGYNFYVYSEKGTLNWFTVKNKKGKVTGTFHQQKVVEEVGEEPYLEEIESSLIGEQGEDGYRFNITDDEEKQKYNVEFDEETFVVQREGKKERQLYYGVVEEELEQYIEVINEQLQVALEQMEEKEHNRINTFHSKLESVYGYLYTSKDDSLQLFIKIDEALREGEISGTMLMIEKTDEKLSPYEETTYDLVGITDGLIVELFTMADGAQMALKGNFSHDASGFNITFWKSDQELSFHAVTEIELTQKINR